MLLSKKSKTNKKQREARGYLKFLVILLYIYFGLALVSILIIGPIIAELMPHDLAQYYGVNSWLIIILTLGLILTYNLNKMKRWALVALIILIGLETATIMVVSLIIEDHLMIPIAPTAILIMLIIGLKYLKK